MRSLLGVISLTEELSRRDRKKLAAKDKILACAVGLFQEKGFDGTSIADIMERADLGVGTFYNYFPSKEGILLSYAMIKISQTQSTIDSILVETTPATEKLEKVLLIIVETFEENQELLLPAFLRRANPKNTATDSSHHSYMFGRILLGIIVDGQKSGTITNDVAPEVILSVVQSILHSALASINSTRSLREDIRQKLALLFNGLRVERQEHES